jgi:hypothetical protein
VLAVRGGGRSGTTMTMELLATSPEIGFDRIFPYEVRHLSYAARVAGLYSQREQPASAPLHPISRWWRRLRASLDRRLDPADVRSVMQTIPEPWSMVGPPRNLLRDERTTQNETLVPNVLRGLWCAVGARIAWSWANQSGVRPKFYAEKTPPWVLELAQVALPTKVLYLIRDPRDVWLSIRSFDQKRGYYGFGRRRGQSERSYLNEFLRSRRELMKRVPDSTEGPEHLVVRYEDLVLSREEQAERMSRWLGCELDRRTPTTYGKKQQAHMTSRSPLESVGRWKQEMDDKTLRLFEREIGDILGKFGYE